MEKHNVFTAPPRVSKEYLMGKVTAANIKVFQAQTRAIEVAGYERRTQELLARYAKQDALRNR